MPVPLDDPTVSNDERLWRRVGPSQIITNPETGESRPSSAVFRSTNEISVARASLTTPAATLENYPKHSLVEFEARVARLAGCIVVCDPLPDDRAHALVYGSGANGRLTKTQAKKIAGQARWVRFQAP